MPKASIAPLAYAKMMIHAAQYPHCAVDGLLIGSTGSDGDASAVDAVPLFHNGTLSPALDVATAAAASDAAASGRAVVGYYAANEHLDDASVARTAGPVADALAKGGTAPVLVQIQNRRLADPADDGLSAFRRSGDVPYADARGSEGIVEFNSEEDRLRCLKDFDGTEFRGQRIGVEMTEGSTAEFFGRTHEKYPDTYPPPRRRHESDYDRQYRRSRSPPRRA